MIFSFSKCPYRKIRSKYVMLKAGEKTSLTQKQADKLTEWGFKVRMFSECSCSAELRDSNPNIFYSNMNSGILATKSQQWLCQPNRGKKDSKSCVNIRRNTGIV
jgi:hypothetical protein